MSIVANVNPDLGRLNVYIDGFNLYHALDSLDNPSLKWLNHIVLARSFLRSAELLGDVHFFTAVLTWDAEKQKRHRAYIKALAAVGVQVHEANFKKSFRKCTEMNRHCRFFEEKQSDVALAVRFVSDAMMGKMTRAILITADSDQVPAVRHVRQNTGVAVSLVFPPGRKAFARELGKAASDAHELTQGRLQTALLPRSVFDSSGRLAATRPAVYE